VQNRNTVAQHDGSGLSKTTLVLPTELLADAKRKATLDGTSLRALCMRGLRIVLGREAAPEAEEETHA
jgi:hypothetical protein